MADLGNLWFSLGLDDKKFEKQWKAALAKYSKDTKINIDFKISEKAVAELKKLKNAGMTPQEAKTYASLATSIMKAASAQEKYNRELVKTKTILQESNARVARQDRSSSVSDTNRTNESLKRQALTRARINKLEKESIANNKRIGKAYNDQSLWIQNLRTLAANYFSIYAVKNFSTEVAMVTGEFEKQRVTLQAMIGEMQGLEIYGKIKELSVVSPFEFKDLASYAKQLAAFSVPYEELYDTTKRLADVSAGLGVDMSRIILAYGQIRSAGVLRGTELRQLTEAGVPILEKLQEKIQATTNKTITMGDVFDKVSQKAISFEMVKDVFEEITSAGGKFYNMQEVQAETLSGKISNLKDAYAIMLTEIGESTEGFLRGGVDALYSLINNWERYGRVILSVAAAYGAYQTVQALAFSWQKLALVGSFTKAFFRMGLNITKAARAMTMLNLATKAGVWGAVAAALTGITVALISAGIAANKFQRDLEGVINIETGNLKNETEELNRLTKAIEETVEGTESRKRAIDEYNSRFGQYLKSLYDEKTALDAIREGNDAVRKSMSDRYKEEALIKARQEVDNNYGKDLKNIKELYSSALREADLGKDASSAMAIIEDVLKANANATRADIKKAFNGAFKEDGKSDILLFRLQAYFDTYKESYLKYYNALRTAMQEVDEAFDLTSYKSWKVEEDRKIIDEEYNKSLKDIRDSEKAGSKALKEKEQDAEIKYLTKLVHLYAEMPEKLKEYQTRLDALTKNKPSWRDRLSKNVEELGLTAEFAPSMTEDYPKYIEKLQGKWKEINENIEKYNGKDVDGGLKVLNKEKDALQKLADLWGFVLDPKGDKKDAKAAEKARVNALKEESQWVRRLYESYKKYLDQGLSSGDARKSALADFEDLPEDIKASFERYGDISHWFRAEWGRIADEAKKGGSDIGKAVSNSMLLQLGTINTSEVLSSLKLGKKIQDELTKWGFEDFALAGEGVTLDVSKALRDEYSANKEAANKKEELLNQLFEAESGNEKQIAALKEKYGKDWANEARERINELYETELANNRKIAEDKISNIGEAYAKEIAKTTFSDDYFSNLGEKSLSELKAASAKLQEIAKNPSFMMDESYLDKVASGDISSEEVEKHIKQWETYFKLLSSDTDIAHFNKVKKAVVASGEALVDMINSFKGLSDGKFDGLLDSLSLTFTTATKVADSFEKVEKKNEETGEITEVLSVNWGNIASAAASLVTNLISAIVASKEYDRQMKKAGEAFNNSIVQSQREMMIAGEQFETIFGENLMGALKADQDAISGIVNELRRASTEVAKIKIVTKKGIFGIGKKETTLKDLAPQLFKADGSVNYEYLDEFLSAYGDKLDDSQKTMLENLKATYEQYESAMGDINDYLSNIFSDTASTIADRMLEAFAATGNAATDLGDLVNNVAKQMAKDLIQSMLVDQYLTPAMERIKALYNPNDKAFEKDATLRTQKAILLTQDAIASAQEAVPEVNKLLEAIQAMGIDLSQDSENASQVLSGLTEDQQNLLMGYINGIRADVSYNKGLLSSIVNSVGTINNNIATALIVWKQIEANTHRSADGVDKIIGYFESVTGPYDGGGGQAFRVNIA